MDTYPPFRLAPAEPCVVPLSATTPQRALRRRLTTNLGTIPILLLLCATLVACDPSAGGGASCKFAASFAQQPLSTTLTADFALKPPKDKSKPAPDKKQRIANCTKQNSPQWAKLKPYKEKIRTNGASGKAARYYEWDNRHNDIEVYGPGPGYKHLGSMNPSNGNMYKDPVANRNLRGKLK